MNPCEHNDTRTVQLRRPPFPPVIMCNECDATLGADTSAGSAYDAGRLRAEVAQRDDRLARIAECLRQMVDWPDYPPANTFLAMALFQVAGIARGVDVSLSEAIRVALPAPKED